MQNAEKINEAAKQVATAVEAWNRAVMRVETIERVHRERLEAQWMQDNNSPTTGR